MAVISGKPVDRRAFTGVLSLYGRKYAGCSPEEYYSDAEKYAAGQKTVAEIFQPDILFAPFALSLLGKAFGGEVHYLEGQAPNLKMPGMRDISEFNSSQMPDINSCPELVYIRDSVKILAEEYKEKIPVAAVTLSPFDLPIMIFGLDRWLEMVLFDTDYMQQVLDNTLPFFIEWVNSLFADGACAVVLPAAFSCPAVISVDIALQKVLPVYNEAFSQLEGPVILHHGGSVLYPFADYLKALPDNVVGYVPGESENLTDFRKKLNGSTVLFAGLEGPSLNAVSPDEVFKRCTGILETVKDDPCFILATCCADIPLNTDEEVIHALRRSVEEFGNG
jgi:uroporphyrinogen decarboxylase